MCDCVFCERDKIKTDFVYEDDLVMAFPDIDPINEGHILVVPREHYLDMDDVPDETLARLIMVSKKVVSALKETYKPDGYGIMQNGGAFNDTGHFHLHVFPRYKGDGFGWTFGESKAVNQEVAKKIRDCIRRDFK